MKILNKSIDKYSDFPAYFFCFLFAIAGVTVSLNRFWQYEVFYYDFGIYDQAIWNVSRFSAPIIDNFVVGGKWIFADHFNPSIFLLSPLYWLTSRSEIILIAQSIIVAMSGLVLYDIGKKILNSRFLSLSVLTSYLLFLGLQNAMISDFHEVTISVFPLMLTFWSLIKKMKLSYFIFLIVTLGFKESSLGLGIGIGILIFFIQKEWLKIGFLTIVISLLWGFLAIHIVIPYFSGGIYQYLPEHLGIFSVLGGFFDSPTKQRTIFYSFLSFGFLPLLSPGFWALIIQDFFIRFIPNWPSRWDLGLHYSAQLACVLAISSLYGVKQLKKYPFASRHLHVIGILIIFNAIYLYRFVLHGPLALSYNTAFYNNTKNFLFLDKLIDKIPLKATVMAQNNLAVRFTHQKVWILRNDYKRYNPDYIIIDARGGQSSNNYFGFNELNSFVAKVKNDSNYLLSYHTQEQYIFKRN